LAFVAKEVKYHNSCRNAFRNEARAKQAKEQSNEQSERTKKMKIREEAFIEITGFIEEIIIGKEQVMKSRDVADHHRVLLAELGLDASDIALERDYLLLGKLADHFEGRISIVKHPVKGVGKIIFSLNLKAENAFKTVFSVNVGITHKVIV